MINLNLAAIDNTRDAIKNALVRLAAAYDALDANSDARIEDSIVSLMDDLTERLSDIDNIAEQIEGDRAPWFTPYAAA